MPEIIPAGEEITSTAADLVSIRDRSLSRRSQQSQPQIHRDQTRTTDRQWRSNRSHQGRPGRRTLSKGSWILYTVFGLSLLGYVVAVLVFQSSVTSVFRHRDGGETVSEGVETGGSVQFVPFGLLKRFEDRGGLDRFRKEARIAVRPPRLALILRSMTKDPTSLMLFTVMKNLQGLGYELKIYTVDYGKARPMWEEMGGPVSKLTPESYGHIDWLIFEGIIVDSLDAREAITSLMQEPFCSVPLIWIIQEDTLANRFQLYEAMGWEHLISYWKNAFTRADVVVFPDFSLPMLYSMFDTGNFYVIPGTPIDAWVAESYLKTQSKYQLRMANEFDKDVLLVLVLGSSLFYGDVSCNHGVALKPIEPLLKRYASGKDAEGSLKFIFLCGNSTDANVLQEVAARLGLPDGSLRHYPMDSDVNSVLLMADIVLYGSSQVEQGFPPLLLRAMVLGIPVIAPDFPIIGKHIIDGVDGIIFRRHIPNALIRAFSLYISSNGKLSRFSRAVAASARHVARHIMASKCITDYAKLLENVLSFPSDALLPGPISQLQRKGWEWNSFRISFEQIADDVLNPKQKSNFVRESSIVYGLEEGLINLTSSWNVSENGTGVPDEDIPRQLDWDVVREIESLEDYEMRETEELEERTERDIGAWEDIYRTAKKSEKLKFETNERDEGELERTGQPVCIYEIYDGVGAWPFLHHGSLYRGLSLSTRSRRLRSDDLDAVGRLPILNNTYYRDILCELGGMFSIANVVDNIHSRPWIGFQSWHASGWKVSLSITAEKVLEETIKDEIKGDVVFFWAPLDTDGVTGKIGMLTFWSMCDILNGGKCRTAFADAFRRMYGLPPDMEALPPMPEDGGQWSALHSWVMPTPSFLEFILFSRMFADSLDSSLTNSSKLTTCVLGSSELETKHCYCRILELLVNVWAYHSGRKMVYINPFTGSLAEQHPIHQRELMWTKYFNFTLLKSMDEDLAEAADDDDYPSDSWLWPSTGEVHWQGIYEREREERYRIKMDKKRKSKEKMLERMKHGYKQKSLG